MELYEYWRIVRRRWWIPLGLLLIVGALSMLTYRAPAPVYQANLRFTVGLPPDPNLQGVDPKLTGPQAAEYIRDDLVEILHSDMFADDVNANLQGTGIHISKDNISGAKTKEHRILTMAITWNDPAQAMAIANAAAKTLATQNAKYFKQLGSDGAEITIIDRPQVTATGIGLRERLDLPIRLALALVAGILLAFLIEYLDDSVRDAREVERMGLNVLGEIPRGK